MRRCRWSALIVSCALLVGCGGGGARLAPVKGTITFKGEPVTGGSLTFAPKGSDDKAHSGRPATGTPDEKGEFRLSTHAKDDGALIGDHIVIYSAPQFPETSDPALRDKMMKLYKKFGKCKLPENHVIQIKPGNNEIKLELIE